MRFPSRRRERGIAPQSVWFTRQASFLYVSNRGHNSIATFAVDSASKTFRSLGNTPSGGEIPRGFGITNDGRWLVLGNQKTGNVVALSIDQETGDLTPVGLKLPLDAAVNVRFDSKWTRGRANSRGGRSLGS